RPGILTAHTRPARARENARTMAAFGCIASLRPQVVHSVACLQVPPSAIFANLRRKHPLLPTQGVWKGDGIRVAAGFQCAGDGGVQRDAAFLLLVAKLKGTNSWHTYRTAYGPRCQTGVYQEPHLAFKRFTPTERVRVQDLQEH